MALDINTRQKSLNKLRTERDEKMNVFSKKIKDNEGAALVYVLIVLVVVSMFIVLIGNLFQSNLRLTKYQERDTKAYYVALAGADLTLAALLQHDTPQEIDDTLLYDHFRPSIANPLPLTDTINLDNGDAAVKVSAIVVDGKRWIEIVSEGTLDESGTKKTVTVQFDYANPVVQKKF